MVDKFDQSLEELKKLVEEAKKDPKKAKNLNAGIKAAWRSGINPRKKVD